MSSENSSPRTPPRRIMLTTPETPVRETRNIARPGTARISRRLWSPSANDDMDLFVPSTEKDKESPAVIETIVEKNPLDTNYTCDVVFSFDTTGSMRAALDSVRQNLTSTIDRLFKEVDGIRIGIIAHGDYCDYPYMCWKIDLTKDIYALKNFICNAKNTSGGDPEENYEFILQQASTFDWQAPAKVFVVIGDEEPHEKGYSMPYAIPGFQSKLHIDWRMEIECLRKKGITIFSCHAFPERASASCLAFYQRISKTTGGYYFPLSELHMFTDYMVAICLKAADGAETITLLKERQGQLQKEIEEMKARNETSSAEYIEKVSDLKEVSEANHHVSLGALFSSPVVAKTASKTRSVLKTKSRVDTFAEEMTTRRRDLDTSSQAFLHTLSQVEDTHMSPLSNGENAMTYNESPLKEKHVTKKRYH